ncbi:MAG: 30S ribosomal protein S1 [Desulfobacterota bacterium]|nr:30S ribosomal protein S1 [Thermodesulfobacteriota bacterium]
MEQTINEQPATQTIMTDPPVAAQDDRGAETFETLLEESLNTKKLQTDAVVQGRVIQITSDYVIVDVGYKSEGQIPIEEFKDLEGTISVNVGDKVDVYVEEWENENGMMVLSKDKADKMRVWDIVSKVYEEDGVIQGKIISKIKGGLVVDIGLKAFLPGSQIDLHPVRDLDRMIGQTFDFKILKLSKKRGNIVLSRRVLLEKERESLRAETIKKLEEGAVLKGIVKNITDYGAFIDLGGIDGLLHVTDISWGRIGSPRDCFNIGDTVEVKVLSFDRENQRVALGYKQLRPNPWDDVPRKYPAGTRVTGKVVNITNYGAFVELEEGVEGLIHISEMSWTKKIKHPSQLLTIGDVIEAVVLDVDTVKKRISLGLKQLEPNPWTVIEEKYPVGTVVEGKIKNITDFGIFIGLDEGIDGLVHISDISWTQKIKHPGEIYRKGDMVKAVVLSIDKENERFSLSIKHLEPDPWDEVPHKYRRGQVITGTVTNVTDFGIFLEIEEGVEGLVHISEISEDKAQNLKELVRVGEPLEVLIISIDKRNRKIGLSLRELKHAQEEQEVKEFLAQQNSESASATIGDVVQASDKIPEPGAPDSASEDAAKKEA